MVDIKNKIEFGDFQTPLDLALNVISAIPNYESYSKIIEPTCGLGTFLRACLENDTDASKIEGWEINPVYVKSANASLKNYGSTLVKIQDFFKINWTDFKSANDRPVLFLGNPPWVTNSELGRLLSKNLPQKYNHNDLPGFDAMTGKSNFDISEWMITKILEFISSTSSAIAFLIKTSVARKLFQYISKHKLKISNISIRKINAKYHFDVSVDACLFQAQGHDKKIKNYKCKVYNQIDSLKSDKIIGVSAGKLIANIKQYNELSYIDKGTEFSWRSGVKHDASKVMEFDFEGKNLTNGFSEKVSLPLKYLYPMYKSSNIAKLEIKPPSKYMLVTQKKYGNDTKSIKYDSPKTWNYLVKHSEKLDSRKSSIYANAPRFSIFGIGQYTFSPWKIVISGLYKNIIFSKIGQYQGKPIIVDDTCYMLGFENETQADFILNLLTSEICRKFIESIIFLDNKRPITIALLNRISLFEIANELGKSEKFYELFKTKNQQMELRF